jgi:transcriptional regulator with XRE-family HTH domain
VEQSNNHAHDVDAPLAFIGEGIRRERERRGMSLAQLAAQVGLTVSAISQIERGASNPSLSSLRRIAAAFDVPMFQFLLAAPRNIVVRKSERARMTFTDSKLQYELVSADTSGEFEVLSAVLEPGADTGDPHNHHAAEECTVVIRGSMVAEVAGERYQLAAGDSIKVHRNLEHFYKNEGTEACEILMIMSPPRFF